MIGGGNLEYAYAKACGIIGKSFLGKRISGLSALNSLGEMDRLVFSGHEYSGSTGQGAGLAAHDIEHRIGRRSLEHIFNIIDCFDDPPEILICQLKSYEYSDLKTFLRSIADGQKELPFFYDIGRFAAVRFNAFPNIHLMVEGTEFSGLLNREIISDKIDILSAEKYLDAQYYKKLNEAVKALSTEDKSIIGKIVSDEISLRNCNWALRLRSYYRKTTAEAKKYLTEGEETNAVLELPLDTRSAWKKWKWERFINPEHSSEHWVFDPRYFQNKASQYLYKLALRGFHQIPLSCSSLFCYIKLKEFEENLLTSVAEGLALGISSSDVLKMLEAA